MYKSTMICSICGLETSAEGGSTYLAEQAAKSQIIEHVTTAHSEAERAKAKLAAGLETMNPGERVTTARDVYRALSRPDDFIGCYTIDEVLGSAAVHRLYHTSIRTR